MEVLYGVKRDMAYRIYSTLQYTAKPRGGASRQKLNQESIHLLLRAVENRPDITLSEMKQLLENEAVIEVSTSAIARKLEGCLVTMKLELIPERRNVAQTKKKKERAFPSGCNTSMKMALESALWTNAVSACILQEHVEDLFEGFQQELLVIRGRHA